MRQFLDRSPSVLREVVTATAVIGDDADTRADQRGHPHRCDPGHVVAARAQRVGILAGSRFRHAGARELVELDGQLGPGPAAQPAPSDAISGRPGGPEAIEHHLVAIRTLCEESLRPVLDAVTCRESTARLSSWRCAGLDCAACARAGERFEEEPIGTRSCVRDGAASSGPVWPPDAMGGCRTVALDRTVRPPR